jgi:hypothetical protein
LRVSIHRNEASQPIEYADAISAYTKGPMYCVLVIDAGVKVVYKYPLCSLFRVVENY